MKRKRLKIRYPKISLAVIKRGLNKTWRVCMTCGEEFPARKINICIDCYQKLWKYNKYHE